MRFIKMHGAGNDYVFLDGFRESLPADLSDWAVRMSDRHTGIGSDGLIVIEPSSVADARMRIWNADGSEAEMCGNGLRCAGKYLFDSGHCPSQRMRVETKAGLLQVEIEETKGPVSRVRVEMGTPVLEAERIPTLLPGNPPLDVGLSLQKAQRDSTCAEEHALPETVTVSCISMGNPHCVVFGEEISKKLVCTVGPLLERHPAFPRRTNVSFVRVQDQGTLQMRVWERGSGETQACGTAACAAVVAASLSGRTERQVACHLPGGKLDVHWQPDDIVTLSGPAVLVFSGEWPEDRHTK